MPSPVNVPDAPPPDQTSARLVWLRRVLTSPTGLQIATTAVNGALLVAYFFHLIRGDLYYKFIEFLFDYHYGIIRRGLVGEIFRHLLPPPYSLTQFQGVANLLLLAAILLFLLIGLIALRHHPHPAVACLLLAIAASPLTFKNQIFDQGRQDIFGLIFLEGIILATLAGRRRTALAVATAGILPLSLIHEGQLLLFVPAGLVILAMRDRAGAWWRGCALPLAVFAGSLVVNWTLPPPRVPFAVYHAYLHSKSVDPFSFAPDWFLYQRLTGARSFAVSELRHLGRYQVAAVWDYLAALATLAVVAFSLPARDGGTGRPRRRFLLAASWLVPGYVVLFWLASDWARWVADFSFCFLLLALLLVVRDRVRPALAPLLVIAALQLAGTGPFGVEVPQLCLGYRAASLVGIRASAAATDYARLIAHQRGVRCLRQSHEVTRAVHYFRRAIAIELRPLDVAYLGIALIRDGQTTKGVAELRAAVRSDPRLVMAHFYLGAALLKQPGQFTAGVAQLHAALRLDPKSPPVLRLLKQIAAHLQTGAPHRP